MEASVRPVETVRLLEMMQELVIVVSSSASLQEQQILFEKWLPQEDLLLRRQGIPLLLGVDPEKWLPLLGERRLMATEERLWTRLQIEFAGVPVANVEEGAEFWRITPRDLYGFACMRGIPLPFAFEQLIQFICKAVRPPAEPQPTGQIVAQAVADLAMASEREKVLGAALNVVAKCGHEVRDENGFVDGATVARLIRARELLWFAEKPCSLTDAQIGELIEHWLV